MQNLRQGEAAHFIKRGGLLSSLRLIFNLKKRTMKGRWVKYLLMGTVVAMLCRLLFSKPTDRGQQYKDGNLPSLSLW